MSIDSEERDQSSKDTVDLSLTSGSDKSNDGNEKKEKRDKKEKNARSTGTHKKTKQAWRSKDMFVDRYTEKYYNDDSSSGTPDDAILSS